MVLFHTKNGLKFFYGLLIFGHQNLDPHPDPPKNLNPDSASVNLDPDSASMNPDPKPWFLLTEMAKP